MIENHYSISIGDIDSIVIQLLLTLSNQINIKKYNCFIFISHDQALTSFKYISNNSGVNFTSDLKIIRVSPDYGTVYDISDKKIVNFNSLLNCFKFINKIHKNRKKN